MDSKKFDKRIVGRNIKKGIVSQKDYQDHLSSLEDLEDKSEVIKIQIGEDDEGDEQDPENEADSPENRNETALEENSQASSKEPDQ